MKDIKILADWNGLMIAALAKASQGLGRKDYATAAAKAVAFIRNKMIIKTRLYHRHAEGRVTTPAFLDDYAFLIWGLIELYETIFDISYLDWALRLTDELLHNFWDEGEGGFFFTSRETRDLPLRRKEIYDGADDTLAMLQSLHWNFILNKVILFRPAEVDAPEILKFASYLKPMIAPNGKATAYVCSKFRCHLPTTEPAKMLALLEKSQGLFLTSLGWEFRQSSRQVLTER